VIASRVDVWLDVRHPEDDMVTSVVQAINHQAQLVADEEGCRVQLVEESYSNTVHFDLPLRDRLAAALPGAPVLDTGAGHDAGVLSSVMPTAMLFVRNPTGVSHSPEEHVEDDDAEAGAVALADALTELVGSTPEK
jgi:N-carbamoyl-L-amino-acid hydrolase